MKVIYGDFIKEKLSKLQAKVFVAKIAIESEFMAIKEGNQKL